MTSKPQKYLNLRTHTDLIDLVDLAAQRADRSRTRQINRYVREGLERDGLLSPIGCESAEASRGSK